MKDASVVLLEVLIRRDYPKEERRVLRQIGSCSQEPAVKEYLIFEFMSTYVLLMRLVLPIAKFSLLHIES